MSSVYHTGSFSSLELDAQQQLPVPNPNLHTREYLVNGQLVSFQGEIAEVTSPICTKGKGQTVIGSIPMLGEEEAHLAADAAVKAFGYGQGEWPKAPPKKRIEALEKFTAGLKAIKGQLVAILMWEICKNAADAEKEVDRTIKYIEDTIKEYKKLVNSEQLLTSDQGFVAKIRRVPLGVVLCSSPTNYPLNELYTTLIPALLIGNAVVLKVPRIGGLVHVPTYKLFQDCFPPGIVNALTGAGRVVMRALMKSGKMDAFAFIGSTKAAQELLREHPKPNRLRSCLGLEAKNAAIIFPDADLDNAVSECVLGSLSFNGMRCTAIKLIYVHSSIAEKFLEKFVKAVDSLPIDLPWEKGAKITPLCERNKVEFLDGLVSDAVSKGAAVSNPRGRKYDHTIYSPTILYPVNSSMRVFHEEQFGPLVPVTTFDDVNSVLHDIAKSDLGQQASVFTRDPEKLGHALDFLAHQVSRVNINCQSQRGPDVFPFTARKDSATATLSVFDALRTFSIRSMVAIKETPENHGLLKDVIKCESSEFMSIDYLVP
jgi:glyceraldehyde-3-phosphate dehydrogenase (NADP+)